VDLSLIFLNITELEKFARFLISFARSWMRRNSHVQFCSRDGTKKEPSTITPKEPDFANNIEEE
jgi:NADH pyrophosphatase NudC (nudix superfamily)